ncbi:MAG: hypothetical protein NVSMB62_21220 [Acidobacteriaceae bacterium]
MAVLSTNEEIASRFAPYLGELHELFGLHGVPFGSPGDLPQLVERLDSGGFFAEDVSSILRSIILREGGSVPQTELLEVVALAAAGPNLDPTNPEVQPAFRRLLSFVGTIARRPWNVPPGDSPAASIPAVTPTPAPAYDHAPAHNEPLPAPTLEAPLQPLEAPYTNGLSNGLSAGFRPFAPRPQVEEPEPSAIDGIPPPKPHSGRNPSWPLWIAAACAIFAVLLLVLFDRAHAPQPVVSPAPNPATAGVVPITSAPNAASQPTKPSATIPLVQGRRPATALAGTTFASRPARPTTTQTGPAAQAPPASTVSSGRTAPPQAPPPATSAANASPAATSPGVRSAPVPASTDTAATTASPVASSVAPLRRPAIALPREGGRMAHGGYFQVSSGVMASHLVRSTDPGYPMLARVAHVQGEVILQAVISPEGEVVATHVLSGHRLLRSAASSAVKQWRYRPFLVDGRPVNVATIVTVDFRDRH